MSKFIDLYNRYIAEKQRLNDEGPDEIHPFGQGRVERLVFKVLKGFENNPKAQFIRDGLNTILRYFELQNRPLRPLLVKVKEGDSPSVQFTQPLTNTDLEDLEEEILRIESLIDEKQAQLDSAIVENGLATQLLEATDPFNQEPHAPLPPNASTSGTWYDEAYDELENNKFNSSLKTSMEVRDRIAKSQELIETYQEDLLSLEDTKSFLHLLLENKSDARVIPGSPDVLVVGYQLGLLTPTESSKKPWPELGVGVLFRQIATLIYDIGVTDLSFSASRAFMPADKIDSQKKPLPLEWNAVSPVDHVVKSYILAYNRVVPLDQHVRVKGVRETSNDRILKRVFEKTLMVDHSVFESKHNNDSYRLRTEWKACPISLPGIGMSVPKVIPKVTPRPIPREDKGKQKVPPSPGSGSFAEVCKGPQKTQSSVQSPEIPDFVQALIREANARADKAEQDFKELKKSFDNLVESLRAKTPEASESDFRRKPNPPPSLRYCRIGSCGKLVVDDTEFCASHKPEVEKLPRCAFTGCKNMPKFKEEYCTPHLKRVHPEPAPVAAQDEPIITPQPEIRAKVRDALHLKTVPEFLNGRNLKDLSKEEKKELKRQTTTPKWALQVAAREGDAGIARIREGLVTSKSVPPPKAKRVEVISKRWASVKEKFKNVPLVHNPGNDKQARQLLYNWRVLKSEAVEAGVPNLLPKLGHRQKLYFSISKPKAQNGPQIIPEKSGSSSLSKAEKKKSKDKIPFTKEQIASAIGVLTALVSTL